MIKSDWLRCPAGWGVSRSTVWQNLKVKLAIAQNNTKRKLQRKLMKKVVEVLANREELIARSLAIVLSQIATAIAERGICTIAAAGGSTPEPLYKALCLEDLPWDKIHVFWGDERYVSPEHPDSNQKMARLAWLDRVNIPASNIHPMPTGAANPAADAKAYQTELQQFLNPAATAPEAFSGLNSRVPSLPEINARPATVALPKNPYQTNLSGSGLTPEAASGAIPVVAPAPIQLLPNVGQSPFANGIGGSRIISPQLSPNSANSQFQPAQRSQLNLPIQPNNFGAVPQNTNQGVQPQPQPFSTPRSLTPGRYLGGGEINTFGNP